MLDLKQKVCIKLTIDWDGNSKFFHGNVNNKNRKNIINELRINGRWSIDVDEIKNETYKFFPSDLQICSVLLIKAFLKHKKSFLDQLSFIFGGLFIKIRKKRKFYEFLNSYQFISQENPFQLLIFCVIFFFEVVICTYNLKAFTFHKTQQNIDVYLFHQNTTHFIYQISINTVYNSLLYKLYK